MFNKGDSVKINYPFDQNFGKVGIVVSPNPAFKDSWFVDINNTKHLYHKDYLITASGFCVGDRVTVKPTLTSFNGKIGTIKVDLGNSLVEVLFDGEVVTVTFDEGNLLRHVGPISNSTQVALKLIPIGTFTKGTRVRVKTPNISSSGKSGIIASNVKNDLCYIDFDSGEKNYLFNTCHLEILSSSPETREFDGFCDACNGLRVHKRGCPPNSPRRAKSL